MANINTKVINIARLSPISTIIPTNTRNTVNGKAVADYVENNNGGTNATEVERIINAKMEKLMQYLDNNFIRGKVVTPDELPPVEERAEDFHYFLIPDENEQPEPDNKG